jgi:hypothetical protein
VTPPTSSIPGRAPAGYRADWALFTDWCAATGAPALPAAVGTVEAFLAGCPAAPATAARRVAAIGWHHRHSPAAGAAVDPPGRRELLGLPPVDPTRPPPDPEALAAAVRALPTTGWTGGFFGRRDAAMLTLAASPLSWTALAGLRTTDVSVAAGCCTCPADTGCPPGPTRRPARRVSGCAGRGRWAWPAGRSPSGCCGPPWTGPRS